MAEKFYHSIPASETGPNVTHFTESGQEWKVTENPKRQKFTLWRRTEEGWLKTAVKASPVPLYDMME